MGRQAQLAPGYQHHECQRRIGCPLYRRWSPAPFLRPGTLPSTQIAPAGGCSNAPSMAALFVLPRAVEDYFPFLPAVVAGGPAAGASSQQALPRRPDLFDSWCGRQPSAGSRMHRNRAGCDGRAVGPARLCRAGVTRRRLDGPCLGQWPWMGSGPPFALFRWPFVQRSGSAAYAHRLGACLIQERLFRALSSRWAGHGLGHGRLVEDRLGFRDVNQLFRWIVLLRSGGPSGAPNFLPRNALGAGVGPPVGAGAGLARELPVVATRSGGAFIHPTPTQPPHTPR